MKRKICVQKVISYKEEELSQCTGKQSYVIKNEENSDYYYNLSNRKMIEVVFASRVSLLAFYFREVKRTCNGLITEHKRVLIQPGERRRNQLTNKSNAQSEKYSPLWKCSKLFIPPQTDGMIQFSFNIGCFKSKVIFK